MIKFFIQSDEVIKLLSTESITVIGLLLGVCALLIYERAQLIRRHEKEKEELKKDIKSAHERLDTEYNNSNKEIKIIIEKYYTLATKVLEKLNTVI